MSTEINRREAARRAAQQMVAERDAVRAMVESYGNHWGALYCSFCGKDQNAVRKLIAGPAVYICDGCVTACTKSPAEKTQSQGNVGPNSLRACSFCGKTDEQIHRLLPTSRESVCDKCLGLCNDILGKELPPSPMVC